MGYDKEYKKLVNKTINQDPDREAILADSKRVKMCISKAGYDTEFEAEINGAKRGQRPYKCLYCRHWHLTTQV